MEINIYPCEEVTRKIQNAIDEVSKNGGGKVILNDGESYLAVRRETFDDVTSLDI